jgi:hypothetical protein
LFEKELKKFNEIRNKLRADNPDGGFVVIKGEEVLGVWQDRMDAIKKGIEKYGDMPLLVKNIYDEDETIDISWNLKFT